MTRPVVVLIGSAAHGPAMLEVLRDWSAIGLISPFVWVAAADATTGHARIPAVLISQGAQDSVGVQDHLADVGRPPVVRVCALDGLSGEAVQAAAAVVAGRLEPAAPGTPITRVHVLLPAIGMAAAGEPAAAIGWHTVVVAPEDADSPASARVLVTAADDSVTVAMHHAAGVAGLLGLWTGASTCVLDDRPVPPGAQVQLMRSYLRHCDAEAVEVSLRNEVLSLEHGIPAAIADGQAMAYVTHEAADVADTADAVLRLHRVLRPTDRVQPQRSDPRKRRLLESLTELLRFIGGAILSAPKQFAHRVVAGTSTRMAKLGQGLVYGDDSAYEIVVRGRLPDGRLASWAELESANADLTKSLGAPAGYREGFSDLSAVWKDFVDAGLTLVDGRHRVEGVPQPRVGSSPAVVARAQSVAPSPDEAFLALPQHVKAELGIEQIPSADLQRTAIVLDELQRQSQHGALALEMARSHDDLDRWRREVQQSSYTGRFGLHLLTQIQQLRDEITQLRGQLERLRNPEFDADAFAAREARRARLTKITIAAMTAVLAGLGIATYFDWLVWTRALLFGVLAGSAGIATVIGIFAAGQRDLFQLLNKRQWEIDAAQAAQQNLRSALADLDRTLMAYRQYTHWATVLGVFLHQPFGPPLPAPPESQQLAGALPRSVHAGVARPVASAVADTARDVRRHLFRAGWLQVPYDALLRDISRYTPAAEYRAHGSSARIYSDPGAADTSPLAQFSRALATSGVRGTGGDLQWAALQPLLTGMPERSAQLLSDIRWSGDRLARPLPAGADSPAAGLPFDGTVLKEEFRLSDGLRVAEATSALIATRTGLTETTVQIQFGHLITAYELGLDRSPPDRTGTSRADQWRNGPIS